MKKLRILLAAALLALGISYSQPASASVDAPTSVESVERPAHNPDFLAFWSCAVARPDPPGSTTPGQLTVNHSHHIPANSNPGHWDWFDCEVYRDPGINGCVYATYYIHDDNPSTGQDYGVFGPFNVTCFGDWPA